ncbi:copper homeostasis protein CutC [Marilutibacter alkalisoli]|uniref:PF03932 family protein CutC n=1 Tax=Marilutibacter alkalisoli TaxID=2591633 RepID=A0A514BQ55_9GAMM|nr:copper homeostasis protein CutC [Lysobacter alkalisoli]QDH69159.1 copper homeostasis protein CutC [Lysobacter alkalisoli]
MSAPLLEIAANSLASALAAQDGGADRVELCENLGEGGCTPSFGTIAVARDKLSIPLYVLIRPRGGDFLYDDFEREVMLRDIETCVRLGCDGVVIGAMDADGEVDKDTCHALVEAAGPLGITFHRALDTARDRSRALEAAIQLGCERVLTSGGQANALAGAATIATLVRQAAGRIKVMAGAGVTPDNLGLLRERSNADEFHASAGAMRCSAMRHRTTGLPGLEPDWRQSDRDRVAALRAALHDD